MHALLAGGQIAFLAPYDAGLFRLRLLHEGVDVAALPADPPAEPLIFGALHLVPVVEVRTPITSAAEYEVGPSITATGTTVTAVWERRSRTPAEQLAAEALAITEDRRLAYETAGATIEALVVALTEAVGEGRPEALATLLEARASVKKAYPKPDHPL